MFIPNFRSIELLELKIHGWNNFISPHAWGALKSPGRIGLKSQKLPAMVLCLGEPLEGVFVVVVVSSFLIFIFLLLFFICRCFSFVVFLHSHLLFDIILHSFEDYCRVFTPILYYQPSPLQSDLRHFHFQPFRDLLTASATVLSGRFLPTGVSYIFFNDYEKHL